MFSRLEVVSLRNRMLIKQFAHALTCNAHLCIKCIEQTMWRPLVSIESRIYHPIVIFIRHFAINIDLSWWNLPLIWRTLRQLDCCLYLVHSVFGGSSSCSGESNGFSAHFVNVFIIEYKQRAILAITMMRKFSAYIPRLRFIQRIENADTYRIVCKCKVYISKLLNVLSVWFVGKIELKLQSYLCFLVWLLFCF